MRKLSLVKSKLKAVLFDLDDTLLRNSMDEFLDEYFRGLGARVGHIIEYPQFVKRLRAATRVMMENEGEALNQELFDREFYPLAGKQKHEVEPFFDQFYQHDYPDLKQYTQPISHAPKVVECALALGLKTALATNPLFPETAILQRMDWAGVGHFPFDLVTTYENSRASKPSLVYYQDIIRHLEVEPQECLMIGNEDWDMVAAHLGIITYFTPDGRSALASTTPQPNYTGSLEGCLEVIKSLAGS